VLLFFSVARSPEIGQGERADGAHGEANTKVAAKATKSAGSAPSFSAHMAFMSSAFDTAAWLDAA
jgi:hypothetical protein